MITYMPCPGGENMEFIYSTRACIFSGGYLIRASQLDQYDSTIVSLSRPCVLCDWLNYLMHALL